MTSNSTSASNQKWLILDRDGVINIDSDKFIKSADEWQPLPGSLEAIARLNLAGYRIVVITNQSGLARGLFDEATLASIHRKFIRLLAEHGGRIEKIYFCPHGPDDHCECRKPLPGLFQEFAQENSISLDGIFALGDSIRDIQAAEAAGASGVLLRTGKGQASVAMIATTPPDDPLRAIPVYDDMAAFTRQLLT